MQPESSILRRARWAEALYALVATLLSLSFVRPLPAHLWFSWVHWTGTAVMAMALAFWLGRPSRSSWLAAAGLSIYSLVNPFWVMAAWNLRHAPRHMLLVSSGLLLLPWLTQLVVAVACWRSRALRHGPLPGASSA